MVVLSKLLFDSVYMRYLEQINPRLQRAGAGGAGREAGEAVGEVFHFSMMRTSGDEVEALVVTVLNATEFFTSK